MALNGQRYVDLVKDYLEMCQERKLEAAESHLAGGAEIVMPWGRFRTLQQLFSAARQRYRWARKQYDTWDVFQYPDSSVVVVVTGTLFGENLQGVPFQGVRYIDRFVVRDEQIALHQVWNDLADSGVLEGKPGRLFDAG
jgi:hypothetical protein